MAKGFGGKYFSLQAITATVAQISAHAINSRCENHHSYRYLSHSESDDAPPDLTDEILALIEPFTPRVSRCQCHCNCFYRRRTRCAIQNALKTPKRRFLFRYFHSTISPPL